MPMQAILDTRLRRNIDWLLLLAVLLILTLCLLTIYNATLTLPGGRSTVVRQGVFFLVGLGIMAYVASRDYANLTRYAGFLYWGNVALLIIVLAFAPDVKGAARWIKLPIPGMDFKLQPSEFAKVCIILTLAAYVARQGPRIAEFKTLLKTLAHVLLPVALIMKQPDLGTSLVFVAIWAGVVFLAGAKLRHLGTLALAGAALFAIAWYGNILHDYQKDRVLTFLDPTRDPKGKGYHVLQSMTAIGGGQVTGQGLGKGIQTNGNFIPENHTDFIFTVVGEEAGFVGAAALLAVYALLLWRGLATIATTEDQLGRLIAGGVVTLFTFHLGVNIGMTVGIMPVVGVPLPLMSYGGSAAWANLTGMGLLFSVGMRRHKIMF
jgi:rod shape determining protein RodA